MLSKHELSDACEAVEKAGQASEMVQILRELLPSLAPSDCPLDAREDWLDLHLMIQPRHSVAACAGWQTRLYDWVASLNLSACVPGCRVVRCRA
jgi:hypothetical protein